MTFAIMFVLTMQFLHSHRWVLSWTRILQMVIRFFTCSHSHLHANFLIAKNGIYTFRVQGGIYHSIGSLLLVDDETPKFLQLYIYDTEHELNNRLAIMPDLHQNTLRIIGTMLDKVNP